MVKRPKLTTSSGDQLLSSKKSRKEQGKDIGEMPDDWDERNIQAWIDLYEKAYPRMIKKLRSGVEQEIRLSGVNKHAEISKDSGMRKGFWLPGELNDVIEKAYPSFWTNKRHAEWFMRHFPIFSFENAAKEVKR